MSVRKRALSFDHAPRPRPLSRFHPPSPILAKRKPQEPQRTTPKRQRHNGMTSLITKFEGLGKRPRNQLEPVRRQKRRFKEQLTHISHKKHEYFDRIRLLQRQLTSCRKINDSRKAQILSDRNLTQRKLNEMRKKQIQLENKIKQLEHSNKWYRAHMAQQNKPHIILR